MEDVWKELWTSSKVLSNYFLSYNETVKDKTCIELGAGCSCLPTIVAAKLGAKFVIATDKLSSVTDDIQEEQLINLKRNLTDEELSRVVLKPLDWNNPQSVIKSISNVASVDLVFGADIFYDPEVFIPIINTVRTILQRFPNAVFIYAYENRNDWLVDLELEWNHLHKEQLYSCFEDDHEIVIYSVRKMTEMEVESIPQSHMDSRPVRTFVGIEGGATHFKFVIIDQDGHQLAEGTGDKLNLLLEGIEGASKKIATTLLDAAQKANIQMPFESIGLGLAGAEDGQVNDNMVEFFVKHYGHICQNIHLTTDAVISIAATFERGGVVIIAGTGSSCRLLREDGEVFGCGGWGHLIGDGGSGYWIAQRAIRRIFDVDDGLVGELDSIEHLRSVVLKHFDQTDKLGLLDILYGSKFTKANIASLCEVLAAEAKGDPVIEKIFYNAGHIIGRHLVAISKNFGQGRFVDIPVLVIGSVWKSWPLIKGGFVDAVAGAKDIKKVSFYKNTESPAIGAAILAAKLKTGFGFDDAKVRKEKATLMDVIKFD